MPFAPPPRPRKKCQKGENPVIVDTPWRITLTPLCRGIRRLLARHSFSVARLLRLQGGDARLRRGGPPAGHPPFEESPDLGSQGRNYRCRYVCCDCRDCTCLSYPRGSCRGRCRDHFLRRAFPQTMSPFSSSLALLGSCLSTLPCHVHIGPQAEPACV